MNYSKIYNQFIEDRKLKDPIGYFEKHHIIPRSLGGSDDESNIIKLSASDHLFAHGLLARIHGGKMIWALHALTNGMSSNMSIRLIRTTKVKRLHYQFIKSNMKMSEDHKRKISEGNKGKRLGIKISDETKRKMSISKKNKIITKEHKGKISKTLIGIKFSDQHKDNISRGRKGIKFSDQHKDNISKSKKGKPAWNKGKPMSDEQKIKISKAMTIKKEKL